MKELELIKKIARVEAPADFERRVLAVLPDRRSERKRTRMIQRFSYAALAAGAAGVVLLIVLVLPKKPGDLPVTSRGAATEVLPIMETMDYSNDIHNASYEQQDIHILEQVSDEASPAEIYY
jgi:hypothetical protein